LGAIVTFWAAIEAFTQPDDGTDSAGMLGLSLLGLAGILTTAAVAVLAWQRITDFLEGPRQASPTAPPGWYQVPSRDAWMWWDGKSWSEQPPG
jgi:hypothetical protein